MKKVLLLLLLGLLCLGLVSCVSTYDTRSKISVNGNGSVELKPDMVRFNVRISEVCDTTKEAQNKANLKISKVLDILKAYNVSEEDIKTQALEIYTEYNWENGKQIRIGESVSQSLTVIVRNLKDFGLIIDDIGAISGVAVSAVSFDASDKTPALEKARKLAFEDAKDKALSYCEAGHLKLGKVYSISEQYSTYNARVSYDAVAEVAASAKLYSAGTEVPNGMLSVRVTVDCTFGIRQ